MIVVKDGFEFNEAYLSRHPGIRKALLEEEIEGISFTVVGFGDSIRPGDTYIAERNAGLKLLTCRSVAPARFIIPEESAYSYDTGECIKIELNIE